MYIDRASKILLGVLVVMLGLLVCRPFLHHGLAQQRVRSYDHVRYLGAFHAGTGEVLLLLDARNGNIWSYGLTERRVNYVGQLTELGQPLVQTQ
jgi:hypothetical protein